MAQRDGPKALGEPCSLPRLSRQMERPGDPRAKILFPHGAQRPCYGRCHAGQRQKMPALWARRLALPALVIKEPRHWDSPVNSPMGPHTITASKTSSHVPAALPCLLHNKITDMQSAKGGPPNRVVALYLQTLLGTRFTATHLDATVGSD